MTERDPVELSDQEVPEELRLANEAVVSHPGFVGFVENTGFLATIKDVVEPNWREALAHMDKPGLDPMLALELIQNMGPPLVRQQYKATLNRHLHNYIASAFTLRDHSRTILHDRTSEVAKRHRARVETMLQDLRMPFVQDLRNYMLHDYLPIVAHRVTVINVNQPDMSMTTQHLLSVAMLLKSDTWSEPSKEFLASCDNTIDLRPLIHDHGANLLKCNTELFNDLEATNQPNLRELNEFVTRANMALTGLSHHQAEELSRQTGLTEFVGI